MNHEYEYETVLKFTHNIIFFGPRVPDVARIDFLGHASNTTDPKRRFKLK